MGGTRLPPSLPISQSIQEAVDRCLDTIFLHMLGVPTIGERFLLVALIVVPTALLFLIHLVQMYIRAERLYQDKLNHRAQRREGTSVHLHFDSKGSLSLQSFHYINHLREWDTVTRLLHELTSCANFLTEMCYPNPELFRLRHVLWAARFAADGVGMDIESIMADRGLDVNIPIAIKETLDLLKDFKEYNIQPIEEAGKTDEEALAKLDDDDVEVREDPEKILDRFLYTCRRIETKIAHSFKEAPKSHEPLDFAPGIFPRNYGFVHQICRARTKYDTGNGRVLLTLGSIFTAFCPVHIMGISSSRVIGALLLVDFLLEFHQAAEAVLLRGIVEVVDAQDPGVIRKKISWPGVATSLRLYTKPMLLPVLLILLLVGASQAEHLQHALSIPDLPHWTLEGQAPESESGHEDFLLTMRGIMNFVLVIFTLLPLTICRSIHNFIVGKLPFMRFLVPSNTVSLHQCLVYAAMAGVVSAAMVWLVGMGRQCFRESNSEACSAFMPSGSTSGFDVYVLRFLIVWPCLFFLLPLGYVKFTDIADNRTLEDMKEINEPEDPKPVQVGDRIEKLIVFIYMKLIDISLLVIPFAGTILSFRLKLHFYLWHLTYLSVLLKMFIKFRQWIHDSFPACCMEAFEIRRADLISDVVERFWWEFTYSLHVIASVVMLTFALLLRFEVFYPLAVTWSIYGVDLLIGVFSSYRNTTLIRAGTIVSTRGGINAALLGGRVEGTSYVVNGHKRGESMPTHARVVMQRPLDFEYKAGQWIHIAFSDGGSHWCMPFLMRPFQQWHAFYIASCEYQEDVIELFVQIPWGKGLVAPEVRVGPCFDENYVKVVRCSHLSDWFFPHFVPKFGQESRSIFHRIVGKKYKVHPGGSFLDLVAKDKSKLKVMKPQLQFTGRLFNVIQAMMDRNGSMVGKRHTKEMESKISIMGPFGTLPWIVEKHKSLILFGKGVGLSTIGAMLRKILADNLKQPTDEKRKHVCVIWNASRMDQLQIHFPALLADLTRYVNVTSLKVLKSWLRVKIFIKSFEAYDYLTTTPSEALFPEGHAMHNSLASVRNWLVGDGGMSSGHQMDGTYITQGAMLGVGFVNIIRRSMFIRECIKRRNSLGICYCGPPDLCAWLRHDLANTIFPMEVDFDSECHESPDWN